MEAFNDIFEDCTSLGTKIPKEDYLTEGKHIVIDQGQKTIAGYTDLEEGLYEDVPAIIFGDHTRIIKYVDEPFFLGADGVKLLKSKRKDANYKYLYYALKNARIPGTGYNRHFKWLKEISIEYPDCGKQQDIVNVLDKISLIIEKRNLELEVLDELIKARFVEMFGDIKNAFERWNGKSFKEVTINLDSKRKPVKDSDRKQMQGPFPYYGATGIVDYVNDYMQEGTFLLVSEDGKALEFRNKPIAFIASGKIWVNNHAHVQLCTEECNMVYLMYHINMMDVRQWVTGIDQKKLNRENLDSIPIALPPIELQEQFAEFVEQVDKSKVVVKKALDEAQTLFGSLMQEYFG